MPNVERLVPVNRQLLIVPHFEEREKEMGVILPDDYKEERERYIRATVVDVSADCKKDFQSLKHGTVRDKKEIIVDRTMIEEVKTKKRTYHMILENYIVGIVRGSHED